MIAAPQKLPKMGEFFSISSFITAECDRDKNGSYAQYVVESTRRRMSEAVMSLLSDGRRVMVHWREENELDKCWPFPQFTETVSLLEHLKNLPTIFRVTVQVVLACPEDADIGEVVHPRAFGWVLSRYKKGEMHYEGGPMFGGEEIAWERVPGGWKRVK
jgi:hypothetical protein